MKKFIEYLMTEGHLNVYKCPFCSKNEAYNGIPGSGYPFRSGAKCFACNKTFSAFGLTLVSKDGPEVGDVPADFPDPRKYFDNKDK